MGNVEAKELTCMTHGHELRWGNIGGRKGAGWMGIKGEKNGTIVIISIISKIYFLKIK